MATAVILEVRHGNKSYRVRKTYCKVRLLRKQNAIQKEDVETEQIGMNEWRSYIICPVCKEKICVNNN